MFGIENAVFNRLPTPIQRQVTQTNQYLSTSQGQKALDWGKTMVAQQIGGKPDGALMNGIQLVSPKLYNAVRLTKGNVFHVPLALLAPNRYFAYRLAKESGNGVTKLETLGILFKPKETALLEVFALAQEGKLKIDPKSLNPLR